MALKFQNRLLTLGTVAMILVGIVLITSANYTQTVAGIVLVILSAIVFMFDVKVMLLDASDTARKY